MLNKQKILAELNAFVRRYRLRKSDIHILGGAALVIRGLREVAGDIDLYIGTNECQRLLGTGDFEDRVVVGKPTTLWLVRDKIDIRNTSYEYDMLFEGFHIQSLESILRLKLNLNREKDKADILKIQKALEK